MAGTDGPLVRLALDQGLTTFAASRRQRSRTGQSWPPFAAN